MHTYDQDDVIEHRDDLTRNMAAGYIQHPPLVGALAAGLTWAKKVVAVRRLQENVTN